jgi:hypothetical protein
MSDRFFFRSRYAGMTRRDSVRVGALTGLGLSLVESLAVRAYGRQAGPPAAKSCILLWLDGGPSHLETFDLKPDAPTEVRGPFSPISTTVPGLEISELLPRTAQLAQHIAVIRSMTSPLGEHGLANHYLLTGYHPSPVIEYPAFGSVVARIRPGNSVLPPYVGIPQAKEGNAGFLGSTFQPFSTGGDPSKEGFQVRDLSLFPEVDASRLNRRMDFVRAFDLYKRAVESDGTSVGHQDSTFERACRMITSPEARQAFDLTAEPTEIRAEYGPRMFGQSCLLARRLVERGVPFVTVTNTGWDTHDGLVLPLKDGFSGAKVGVGLVPTFDAGFAALIGDLHARGMLDETLVIAMGEFGRTPKLNPRGGRDHWPRVFSVVMAGAGISGGQVIGSSDRTGESPQDDPVTPNDLAATIYTLLGIDPAHELVTPDGRPIRVNQGGRLITQLL